MKPLFLEENRLKFELPLPPLTNAQRRKLLRRISVISLERYRLMQSRSNIRCGTMKRHSVRAAMVEQISSLIESMACRFETIIGILLADGVPREYIDEYLWYNRECWESKNDPPFPIQQFNANRISLGMPMLKKGVTQP